MGAHYIWDFSVHVPLASYPGSFPLPDAKEPGTRLMYLVLCCKINSNSNSNCRDLYNYCTFTKEICIFTVQ